MENKHRNEYKSEKLSEIFHPSLTYLFQKIYEAFHNDERVPQAKSHIPMIREMVTKLQVKLEERGELKTNYYAKDKFVSFTYAIEKLESYFSDKEESNLNSKDAEIYCEYAEARLKELRNLAQEVDEEYEKEIS